MKNFNYLPRKLFDKKGKIMAILKGIAFDWGGVLIKNLVDDFAKKCANLINVSENFLELIIKNLVLILKKDFVRKILFGIKWKRL